MTIENCIAIYETLRGKNDIKPTIFFEGREFEQSIFVPGWRFTAEETQTELFRAQGINESGETIVVQDEKQELLPEKLENAAIEASLKNPQIRGSFIFCLLAGRLILLEDPFNCTILKNGWKLVRDNIEITWDEDTELLTILQDKKTYYKACFSAEKIGDVIFEDCIAKLKTVSGLVATSIQQDELFIQLTERYPDFADNIIRSIDLFNENAVVYQLRQPSPSDSTKQLWVFFDQDSAGIGLFPYILVDDVGLHIDAVSGYINRIINEEVVLLHTYKNEQQFDEGNFISQSWIQAPAEGTHEAFENLLAKNAKGLKKLFNKNKVYDAFSWNGTFTTTVKI